ncbi:MAG TPA: response regulator, partial [Elusimicrobiota bacterium]|nr:response regulator [Elusimicrobiota bacterium]
MTSTNSSILIIDDEQGIREMLSYALSARDYRAVTAASGVEALKHIEEMTFDLAILDLRLGDIDGLLVLEALIKRSADCGVVVITGHPSLETTVRAMQLGASDCLAKPFQLTDIYSAIKKLSDRQTLARELARSEEMNRLKSELLLNVAHDCVAGLEKILRCAQRLSALLPSRPDTSRSDCVLIENLAAHLLRWVRGVVDFQRIAAGHIPSTPLESKELMDTFASLRTRHAKAHVLVVDDDENIVELMTMLLERAGFFVEAARDGRAALDQLYRQRPDFLILDLMLPKLGGLEVLDEISQNPSLKNMPVIVLTAKQLTNLEMR